jgi:hypothetical protein
VAAVVNAKLAAKFAALDDNPGLGVAVPGYSPGLNVFIVSRYRFPNSTGAVLYTSTKSTVTIVSYVDEHYRYELRGVFDTLGLE